MIARLGRMIGWRILANLILLLIIIGSLGGGLSSTVKGIERSLISSLIILALLMGMLLASSRLSGSRAGWIGGLSGVLGAFTYSAGLTNPFMSMIRALTAIPNWLATAHTWPDLTPLALAWQQFIGQLSALLIRISTWFAALLGGKQAVDPVVNSLLWGLTLWFITIWAAWAVFRFHRPLPAIAPAGILLAGILSYTRGNAIILVPLVAATLLLMALNRYDEEEQYWVKNQIDYAEDIKLDMLTVIPLLVIGLVALSVFTPSLSFKQMVSLVQEISEPFQSQSESLGESLGLEQATVIPAALGPLRSPGLPQQHLLGSGPELSQQVVMVIQTGDLPAYPALELLPHPPVNYYWRAATYDFYTGRGWATSPTDSFQYKAGTSAIAGIPTDNLSVRLIEQTVYFSQDSPGVLVATGLLMSADVDFEVFWRIPMDDTADAFSVIAEAQQYIATSLLNSPSTAQMRNALPVYPDWILRRYLSLPDSLPQRVRDLALKLTRGQPTPYDQATAIQSFLRDFPYTLDVPLPPPNRDVTDYFLFDLQQGYCDYYATAMVVLSRAAGLPARLVSGYASGTYDAPNARYVVTADKAHSWVEIYFSDIGWVEFEPTGGLPAIIRTEDQTGSPLEISDPKPVARFDLFDWLQGTSWELWIFGFICCIIAAITLWYLIEFWHLSHLPSQLLVSYIYQRLQAHGVRLSVGQQSGDTPYEFAARLGTIIHLLITRGTLRKILQPARGEIDQLVQLYAQTWYSLHPIPSKEHTQAVHTWNRLRWRLLVTRLYRKRI